MKQSYQIWVMDTDETFTCNADMNVLEAMKRAGAGPVRHGCFGGGCGVCKMKVLSGDYEVVKRMSRAHVPKEEQEVLMCCIVPKTDLILTAQI